MATYTSDGSALDTNNKIAGAANGDTVFIPAGTWTWDRTVVVPQKSIKLLGATGTIDSGTLPLIQGQPGVSPLIDYVCEDASSFTAELGNLEVFGEPGQGQYNVKVRGVKTIGVSGLVYSGGMKIHDIRFSNALTPIDTAIAGRHFLLDGWVIGVMYHCEIRESLQRVGAETMIICHTSSPSGTGDNGDWSYYSLPAGRTFLSGSLEVFTIEDCILRHVGAMTDSGGDVGGGGRYCCRHNTHWGAWAMHGTRESGGGGRGARLCECYNNHAIRNNTTIQTKKRNTGWVEGRDGEMTMYNNFMTAQTGSVLETVVRHFGNVAVIGASTVSSNDRWGYCADGLNPWDKNAKADGSGNYTDPATSRTYHVFDTYNYTQTDPQGLTYSGGSNQVIAGVNVSDTRFSDVFGTVTIGTGGFINPTSNTLAGVSVNGHSSIPNDITGYFDGFVLRNAELSRTFGISADPTTCFQYIIHSSGTKANATFELQQSNGAFSGHPRLNLAGSHLELRKIETYFGVPGTGGQDFPFVINSDPAQLATVASAGTIALGAPNPRFASTVPGGVYEIGNRIRNGGGAFGPEDDLGRVVPWNAATGGGDASLICRDYRAFKKQASTATDAEVAQFFKAGYPFNRSISSFDGNNPATRVGADWTNQYVQFAGGTGGTPTPEFASFFVDGAVQSTDNPYPHVLRQTPSGVAPSFSSPNSKTFTAGVSDSFTVVAGGIPAPTMSQTGTLPSGATFTPNSPVDGKGVLAWANPVAGTYSAINFRAINASGTANQPFTLTVTTPALILISPTDGSTFVEGTPIPFQATLTGASGTVDFYAGATKVGSATTSPYQFNWTTAGVGTYSLTAKFSTTTSNAVSVTVSAAQVPPTLSAPTIVVTG